ncbi:MAG: hypothetical protein ACREFD_08230 [Stellaceae bacterium]
MRRAFIRLWPLALAAAVLVSPAVAGAATLVVVSARGIDLTPGAQVDSARPLPLKDGQMVTLIAPTGTIIKLRGPRGGLPAPGGAALSTVNVAAALRTLVTQQLSSRTTLGVVRGASAAPIPPSPWLVDISHDGTRCVPAGRRIVFWRPGGGGAVTMTIAPDDRSWIATADWRAGHDRLVVPRSIPLRDRETYFVALGKHGNERAITLILLPAALTNDAMRAAWMIEAGCAPQVRSLLRLARR